MAKRKQQKSAKRGPRLSVTTSTKTLIRFKHPGRPSREEEIYTIEVCPSHYIGNCVRVIAPCASEVDMAKDQAIAVANAILEVANSL